MTTVPKPSAQKHCALCRKPVTDRLTGVLERSEWDARASRAIARARRRGQPVAVVLADLDRFKDVNDRYGHVAGDEVLRAVAGALDRTANSIVGRYGGHAGDEFLMLLPGATEEEALAVARSAQEAVRRLTVRARASRSSTVTLTGQAVSMGVAAAMGPGASREGLADLLLDADVALRAAKRAGGDRACGSAGGAAASGAASGGRGPVMAELPRQRRGASARGGIRAAAEGHHDGEVSISLESLGADAVGLPGELVLSAAGAERLHALLGEALGYAPESPAPTRV